MATRTVPVGPGSFVWAWIDGEAHDAAIVQVHNNGATVKLAGGEIRLVGWADIFVSARGLSAMGTNEPLSAA